MKRILSIILAAVMLAVSLTALASCGNSVDASKDVENIKKAGVLKVGMECAYAPYNWTQTNADNDAVKIKNADGYANGYDVQAARKIALRWALSLRSTHTSGMRLFPLLNPVRLIVSLPV